MSKKIQDALKLCSNKDDFANFNKGLALFQTLCMNSMYSNATRIEAIRCLFEVASDEANDKLARCRQGLMFFQGEQLDTELSFLEDVAKTPTLNSYERLRICVDLYDNHFIDRCYPCFIAVCNDKAANVKHRVDACRYLLYSENDDNYNIANTVLEEVVQDEVYPSKYRYEVIASLNSKTGLSTMFNQNKLNVEYDENLLYKLQMMYFFNKNNEARFRLLSGQHLLQMKIKKDKENKNDENELDKSEGVITKEEKVNIGNEILRIAREYEHDDHEETYNCRADAADIVSRLGTDEQRTEAMTIITELGYSGSSKFGKATIYDNAQNVHEITEHVNSFIESLVEKNKDKELDTYQNIQTAITNYIYSLGLESRESFKAFKSLSRISLDTAVFTKYRINASTLLIHIWIYIKNQQEDLVDMLKRRLIDELIDMAFTCSTGHSNRLVNVLNGYGFEVTISWRDQVIANCNARIQARIKLVENEDLKGSIICGMSADLSEPEDRKNYIEFVKDNSESLKDELRKEFVADGFIKEEEFINYFNEAFEGWMHQ